MTIMQGFEYFKNFKDKQYAYYRSTLKDSERKIYDKLRDGFLAYSKAIPVQAADASQISVILEKLKQDNPFIFFVESAAYQYAPFINSGAVIPKYRFSKEEINATLSSLINKCESIVSACMGADEGEKEKLIHDFFCRNIRYDTDFSASSFECVGSLLFGKGVCEGISKAAKLLFDFVDIQSLVVSGRSKQQHSTPSAIGDMHAWNIVRINGSHYHFDVTFDLTVQAFGIVRYDYFNLSDSEIQNDHTILSSSIPPCLQSGCFYRANQMYVHTQSDYRSYLMKCIKNGETDIVFKLPNVPNLTTTKKKLMDITADTLSKSVVFASHYQLLSNDTQFVFHLHVS